MTLAAGEFIRRFLLHVLPAGFHRIRDYGFLGARHRREKLARCRQLLGCLPPAPTRHTATAASDYRDRVEALRATSEVTSRVLEIAHHFNPHSRAPVRRLGPRHLLPTVAAGHHHSRSERSRAAAGQEILCFMWREDPHGNRFI
jgi:hypothetical protein